MKTLWPALALAAAVTNAARADPTVLRIAAIAPDGTAWAREMKALSRDVAASTKGALELKWYLGGIAGDEEAALARIRRGQLDGAAGALFCNELAPSLNVMRVVGVVRSWDEATFLYTQLRPQLDDEFLKSGFIELAIGGFGSEVLLTRDPVRSLEQLTRGHYFIWDLDKVMKAHLGGLGLHTVSLPVEEAARAFDEGRTDGFIAIPTAALAYQWATRARYLLRLRFAFLTGCLVLTTQAFDRLPFEHREALRAAAAKFVARFQDVSREQENQLLGGLLERQGVIQLPSEALRGALLQAAVPARGRISDHLVPRLLLERALGLLADFRAEHSPASGR